MKIPEYWIVDCQASCIHVFRSPVGDDYQIHKVAWAPEKISPFANAAAVLDLRELIEGE